MSCTGEGDNYTPDLALQVDVPIDGEFVHGGYCNYGGNHGSSSVNCGNNDEFVSSGASDDVCCCHGISTCRRHKCKRVSYTGALSTCCINKNQYYMEGDQVKTCAPSSRDYNNSGCDSTMLNYCSQGTNFFLTQCRDWYLTRQKTGSGVGDQLLLDVCNRPENIDRKECGCVAAANELQAKYSGTTLTQVPVECTWIKCAGTPEALKSFNQFHNPCDIVFCQQIVDNIDLISNGSGDFDVDIIQECSREDSTTVPPEGDGGDGSGGGSGGGGAAPNPVADETSFWTPLNITLIILGILVLIGIIYYFTRPAATVAPIPVPIPTIAHTGGYDIIRLYNHNLNKLY
jgi:hypothetical protein